MPDNKKFTKGETNLMKEFGLNGFDPYETAKEYEATNPFSGVAVQLNTFGATLYALIKGMEAKYNRRDKTFKQQKFDRLRMLFLKLFPSEWMDLLD